MVVVDVTKPFLWLCAMIWVIWRSKRGHTQCVDCTRANRWHLFSTCLVMDAVRFEPLILQPMAMSFKLSHWLTVYHKTKRSRISFCLTSLLLILSRHISLHSALLPTMPGTTVSPSTGVTVGSPAAKSAVASSSSLFDTVRNHTHIQSDWENYNKSPTGEVTTKVLPVKRRKSINWCKIWLRIFLLAEFPKTSARKCTVQTSGKDVVISFDGSHDSYGMKDCTRGDWSL